VCYDITLQNSRVLSRCQHFTRSKLPITRRQVCRIRRHLRRMSAHLSVPILTCPSRSLAEWLRSGDRTRTQPPACSVTLCLRSPGGATTAVLVARYAHCYVISSYLHLCSRYLLCCYLLLLVPLCLQCFDAVGWAAGRASGL